MKTSNILLLVGGPNGSGKSTVTSIYPAVGYYINADEIQRHLGCTPLQAAQIAEDTREYMLAEHNDFTFESVLSTERNYNLMRRARDEGYKVICVYVLTADVEINISRVKSRVKNGGHDVPEDKIRARYQRAMRLFPVLFDVCDELYVYDNSFDRAQGEPSMIVKFQYGKLEIIPNSFWSSSMLENLCNGTYGKS